MASLQLNEIKLEVTQWCPLQCVHCSSGGGPGAHRVMAEEDCLRIVGEAADLGATQAVFSGGEPLGWPAINAAVECACNRALNTTVYTTGNVPEPAKRMRELAELGVHSCVFSVFGDSSDAHDGITTCPGSLARTVEAMEEAAAAGLRTEVHFVPLACNCARLERVVALAEGTGAGRVSVLRLVPQGRGRELCHQLLSREQNLELRRAIAELSRQGHDVRVGSPYNFLMLCDRPMCNSGMDRLTVAPDLRIYPCDAFKNVLAEHVVGIDPWCSLVGRSLAACWADSLYLQAVRQCVRAPQTEPCASCETLSRCGSGCLAQKYLANGDLAGRPDPMCLRQVMLA